MKNIIPQPKNIKEIYKRKWMLPYMGDYSRVGAACLRHFGMEADTLPTNTSLGRDLSSKHICTETCFPLKGVVGDTLGFLKNKQKEKGENYPKDKYFIMLPTTHGPCRFGKYQEVLRIFMDKEGFEEVPIGGPTTATDYKDILTNKKANRKLQKNLLKGILTSGFLDDIVLRYRPYSDQNKIENLKQKKLSDLEDIIENTPSTKEILKWGKETCNEFKKLDNGERYPLVLYAGEIYMRQHDPYTNHVIKKLESQKLEVIRSPVMEWLEYINFDNKEKSKKELKKLNLSETKNLLGHLIKGTYIKHLEKKLSEPFQDILSDRHTLPKPKEIIQELEKNKQYNSEIAGESILSIGLAHYLINNKINSKNPITGFFHVGPFTCMQEGVSREKIEAMVSRKLEKNPNLIFPRVHANFGESPNPNLNSEIGVFKEQCYQKRKILKKILKRP